MKKIIYIIFLLVLSAFAYADCNYYGDLYLSTSCGGDLNNNTIFNVGDTVYVNGIRWAPNCSISYYVESQCYPKQIKTVGWITTGSYGAFCIPVNVIEDNECGQYELVTESQHHRSYGISRPNTIPEFTSLGACLALLGTAGIYIYKRRK